MPSEKSKLKQRYRVWDPHDDEKSARMIDAMSQTDAAETYAEDDEEGQRAGLYNNSWGHPLHVLDSDGDGWEVHVVLESRPTAAAVKSGRLR